MRIYIKATRSSAPAAGNIDNEIIASISFTHDGKIQEFLNSSGGAYLSGSVNSYYTGSIKNYDTYSTLNVYLGATTPSSITSTTVTTSANYSTFIVCPAILNLDAF